MAFSFFNGSERNEELRTQSRHTSGDDSLFSSFNPPPPHTSSGRPPSHHATLSDARASLQRRFTTNTVPTSTGLSYIAQQRRQAVDFPLPDMSFQFNHKVKLVEKKQADYELLKKKRQELQDEMSLLELQAKREEDDMLRLQKDLQYPNGLGHQSEPTTPPEYRDNGFPSAFSRPNRFSASSLTSPPGLVNRSRRTGSIVASPPSERALAYQALTSQGPSQSVPDSRRNSDGEDDEYEHSVLDFNHRGAAAVNRISLPVTRRDLGVRNGIPDLAPLGPVNTSSFLFDDDMERSDLTTSPISRPHYLQVKTTADNFPMLVSGKMTFTDSSQALDLASSQADDWPATFGRHSLNGLSLQKAENGHSAGDSPPYGLPHPGSSGSVTPNKSAQPNRHSMGAKIGSYAENKRSSLITTPPNGVKIPAGSNPPKLQSSYSTSDIPTVKNAPQTSNGQITPAATAEQRLHNHNVSLGRIPYSASNSNRHSREVLASELKPEEPTEPLPSLQTLQSMLQANATSFGATTLSSPEQTPANPSLTTTSVPQTNQGFYSGYNVPNTIQNGMPALNTVMANMQLAQQPQWAGQGVQMYPAQYQAFNPSYNPYQQYGPSRFADSQARVIQQRRTQNGEGQNENARFSNIPLENLRGEIYGLCKDQHGCRYLQKKLEEHKPESIQLIFSETHEHMIELMTDPFGNYLCQKLLEFTNDEQRTALINNAAPHMAKIALNQHGTRALQKMIEYVSTKEQIDTVVESLRDQVVPMIQDLNGNHVIQKCLNRLSSADAQFVFDAVAANCVVVGTHRHGCCVIQRCIDHASGNQKAQLVAAITNCSFPLVQDPFGNYVLQYIFDQGEESFSQPLCRTFLGHIPMLSKQKFSSNVIEKCIRIADHDTKHLMIAEIVQCNDFDRLADDPFANYVVQTAWDYADPEDEARMAERIRPLLARMRHKPYCRRFQTRIQERDKKLGISPSGSMTPIDAASPDSTPLSATRVVCSTSANA